MKPSVFPPAFDLTERFGAIWHRRFITRRDRQELMWALLDDPLTSEDRVLIDRLLYAIRRGWLTIID